jgi:hypothetical protein
MMMVEKSLDDSLRAIPVAPMRSPVPQQGSLDGLDLRLDLSLSESMERAGVETV